MLFDDAETMNAHHRKLESGHIAPVNKRTPLLSNLDNIENVALIKEVHEHLPRYEAHALAKEAFHRSGYEKILYSRRSESDQEERFVTKLIRATMLQYAKIVITTPFVQIDDKKPIGFFLELFERLHIAERVVILDMKTNRQKYEEGGDRCHIVI